MQVEPVMTSDVTHIVMRKERAQYWTVEAHVSFVVDDGAEVTFSPYNFDGENDLPKLPTFDEDGKPMNGEPSRWGGESPVELPVHAVVRVLDALDDAVSYGQAGADDDGDLQPRVNEWDNAAMNLWKSVPEGTDAQE
jgi:hypothetical protein